MATTLEEQPGVAWLQAVEALCARADGRFSWSEDRRRCGTYFHGLVSGAERKNCW